MDLFNKYFWIQKYKYNRIGVKHASFRYFNRNQEKDQ